MNRQKVFNTVKQHLLTQKRRSIRKGTPNCLYRGPNGLKCAIGVLIKDEHFKEYFNVYSVHDYAVKEALCKSLRVKAISSEDTKFLAELQAVHDSKKILISRWPKALAQVAKKFGLKNPRIKKSER